jgi:hypothetical protein
MCAWLKLSACMAVSCAWRMISKLNVNPFQAVNSPLAEHVHLIVTVSATK